MSGQRESSSITIESSGRKSDQKVKDLQGQVNDVMNVMKENVNKIIDRGENLDRVEERALNLENSANHFRSSSKQVYKKYWWKNAKCNMIIGAVVLTVVVIVSVSIYYS
jgi:DNA repair ATPase RecN